MHLLLFQVCVLPIDLISAPVFHLLMSLLSYYPSRPHIQSQLEIQTSYRRVGISGGIRPQLLFGSFNGQSLKPVDVDGAFASLFVVLGSNPQIVRNSRIQILFFLFNNLILIFFHPFSSSVSVLLRLNAVVVNDWTATQRGCGGGEKRGEAQLLSSQGLVEGLRPICM